MQNLTLDYLRCEARLNPFGIGVPAPRLSWILQSPKRGAGQSAYQILVASSRDKLLHHQGDLWDCCKVPSAETFSIEYSGKPLTSEQSCFWKVRIWDEVGQPSAWSETADWVMGLLHAEDWQAQWIGWDAPPARKPKRRGLPGHRR